MSLEIIVREARICVNGVDRAVPHYVGGDCLDWALGLAEQCYAAGQRDGMARVAAKLSPQALSESARLALGVNDAE